MASRYTKLNSKYILAKRHQTIEQGTLYERDWTTIGNVHRLEPGKRAYYGSGNFIFTENTFPVYKKKRKTGNLVGAYTYEDVKDATDVVNLITLNTDSENLSDYAYWGSMTELFRGSVENIIKKFPGMLRSTKRKFLIHHHDISNDGNEYWTEAPGFILSNPFGYDLHDENYDTDDEFAFKYVSQNFRNFVFDNYDNRQVYPLTFYEIHDDENDRVQYDCEGRYFKLGYIIVFGGEYTLIIDVYRADGEIVYCYRDNNLSVEFEVTYHSGLVGGSDSAQSKQVTEVEESDTTNYPELPSNFSIHPNGTVIERYFDGLSGFEWKLLNRKTNPLYQNVFLLPSQGNDGNWNLVRRKYAWPAEGYCIDIESTDYNSFINDMLSLCEVYDNLWCDSIWRCMVHESVKNFDWSYRREYEDNDAEENIEGGNRMKDVMRLYGIFYDTAKRYVDGIGMYNNVSYDGYNNCPTAQISDRNILLGWDMASTQHQFYWYEELETAPNTDSIVSLPAVPVIVDDESPDYIAVTCATDYNAVFYEKKTLPVSDIMLDSEFFNLELTSDNPDITPSEAIIVVQKQDNPWIADNSYGMVYVEVTLTSIPSQYQDFTDCTFNDYPYQLYDAENDRHVYINFTSSRAYYGLYPIYFTRIGDNTPINETSFPPYVKVLSNNGTHYYKLLKGLEIAQNNQKYVHGTWFPTRNENAVTTESVDILFNRMLQLSSNRIFKSKGTRESIEMAMALFGFGLYDSETNPYGDFKLEERYVSYTPKGYEDIFYFYEETEQLEETYATGYGTIQEYIIYNPVTKDSPKYLSLTTTVEDSTLTTYYRLNGDYTTYDVVKMLYAHRTTERDEEDTYYAGVPIKDIYSGNTHLIVPFNDSNKRYEGNLYFEGKGGWMKNGEKTNGGWEYSETIPYLHILQKINDLFLLDTSADMNGDIYFVADVSDYYVYDANVPYYLSNFFKLKDKYNSGMFSSWVNIPIEGPIQFGDSGIQGVTYEDYRHAKHLDSIIPTILFNNPHCGYGRYDMGDEYKRYMQFPYTSSIENYQYDDEYYRNLAQQFYFPMATVYGDKSGIVDNQSETSAVIGNDKYLKLTLLTDNYMVDHRMHLEYMRNVVMKFVAQVIPSTTLLVLENFVPSHVVSTDYATITVNVNGHGVVYGVDPVGQSTESYSGSFLKSTMVTLKAVPNEGYHFDNWVWSETRAANSISTNDEITIMVCSNQSYTVNFVEDCGIVYGCTTLNGGGDPSER